MICQIQPSFSSVDQTLKLSSPLLFCFIWIQQSVFKIIPDQRFFTPREAFGDEEFSGGDEAFSNAL
jgi:hypothetical protein